MNWSRLSSAILIIWIFCCSPKHATSAEIKPPSESDIETLATFTANQGLAQLVLQNYPFALDELQRAAACLERANRASPETEFLIRFGEAVAFDNLGNHLAAEKSLEQLSRLFDECEPGEEDADTEETSIEEPLALLKQIAALAPTMSVRDSLLSYLDQNSETVFCSSHGQMEANKHSSHFWRQVGKICKEVVLQILGKYVDNWLKTHNSK